MNRDGFFVDPAFTKTTATTVHNDTTFDGTVDGNAYTTPLYADPSLCGKGLVYFATQNNNVYALDEATGTPVWKVSLGTPAQQSGAGCGDVSPIGVTGTPAIDPATKTLVVDAAIADAGGNIGSHTVFGIDACNGFPAGGMPKWSVNLSMVKDSMGRAFTPQPQNQRGAALILNGNAYFVFGGHIGDCSGYNGWVMSIPLDGNVANARGWRTDSDQSGIWGPGGAASDGQSIFVTTGNIHDGTFGQSWAGSESLMRLGLDLSFTGPCCGGTAGSTNTADYFTPANWDNLDRNDTDMSGSGPLVIDAPSMTPSALVMAMGKDGNLYLVDRSGFGGIGATIVGQSHVLDGEISNAGAFATVGGSTYVVMRPNGTGNVGSGCMTGSGDLVAVKLDMTAPNKMATIWCANSGGNSSPVITSSDGANDAMVWIAGAEGDSQLHAFDLLTGTQVFAGGSVNNMRHLSSSLLVANGRIYAAGDGKVYALKP
jgi:outer membrane protein assembly factor BamB